MAQATLRTFRAGTMAQALADVRTDLGPDAVILHTRTFKTGRVLGMGGRQVVEITASLATDSIRPRRTRQPAPQTTVQSQSIPQTVRPQRVQAVERPAPSDEDMTRRLDEALSGLGTPARAGRSARRMAPRSRIELRDRLQRELSEPQTPQRPSQRREPQAQSTDRADIPVEPKPSRAAPIHRAASIPLAETPSAPVSGATPDSLATRVPFAPVNDEAGNVLRAELDSIKRMMGQVLQTTRRSAVSSHANPGSAAIGGMPDALFDIYRALIEQDTDGAIADQIAGAIRDELNASELSDDSIVRQAALRQIAKAIPVAGPPSIRRDVQDGPLVIALVGPTGVGKTTTLAKLAAAYKLRHAKRVALVTGDTYRIAAVEQLRTYANIIGVPLRVVNDAPEMRAIRTSFDDHEIVLIDTPGRSQHDGDRLAELQALIDAAQPNQTQLVLSLAAAEGVLKRAAERFVPIGPDRLILTKLDEAVSFGSILNVGKATDLPLSFVTTGQEVPDHIEPASADRLARLVLDGQPAPAPART